MPRLVSRGKGAAAAPIPGIIAGGGGGLRKNCTRQRQEGEQSRKIPEMYEKKLGIQNGLKALVGQSIRASELMMSSALHTAPHS